MAPHFTNPQINPCGSTENIMCLTFLHLLVSKRSVSKNLLFSLNAFKYTQKPCILFYLLSNIPLYIRKLEGKSSVTG